MEPTFITECADAVAEQVTEQNERESKTASTNVEPAKVARKPDDRKKVPHVIVVAALLTALTIVAALTSTHILSKAPAQAQPAEAVPVTPDPNFVTIEEPQMQSIKLAAATLQSFRTEKVATGKIAFNEDFMTPVFSPYTGRVIRLVARPGDVIKQGSPLFEIDTPDLVQVESDLITAGISLAKSKAALEMTRRTEDRQHRLYANKAVALKDWEQAEADLKSTERDVRAAESTLAAARARLRVFGKTEEEIVKIETDRQVDRVTRVRSPLAGTITTRKVGPGQYVKPDSPDPLFTVANLSTAWILADIYESDVPLLKVGQPVEVHVAAYPNELFTARVSYISPSVDPTTHRVAVRGVIENRGQRLKPDMFASFRVLTASEIQSLAVPASAIIRDGDRTSVWIVQATNRFARREVTIGIEQRGYIQILSGLQQDDSVVSEGSLFISNAAGSSP
jgi:cobalt-zinc-cadmium efflux system membrane fusion protein